MMPATFRPMTFTIHSFIPSSTRHLALLLVASCGLVASTFAQRVVKAEFLSGPERAATDGPHQKLYSTTFCTFVLDLAVTRDGKVSTATLNAPLTTCTDSAMLAKAVVLARSYVFSAAPSAPEPQPVRITFAIGDPVNDLPESMDGPAMPEPVAEEDDHTYDVVQEPPHFPGGEAAMNLYLQKNLHYPVDAQEAQQQGKVLLSFVVTADGALEEIKLVRGIYPSLDKEAIRMVKSMPKWIPGAQNGKHVRVRCTVPVTFMIR